MFLYCQNVSLAFCRPISLYFQRSEIPFFPAFCQPLENILVFVVWDIHYTHIRSSDSSICLLPCLVWHICGDMFDRRMQSSVEEEQALWDCGRTGCCPCRTKSLEIVLKVSKDDWPESLLVILGSLYTSLLLTYATSYACRDLWTSIPKLRSATMQPISQHT